MRYTTCNLLIVDLGRQGENLARTIEFDVSDMLTEWPGSRIELAVKRKGDSEPYLAQTRLEGNVLYWPITYADTAYPGVGQLEIRAYSNEVLVKSAIGKTWVANSLTNNHHIPPDPSKWWVDQVLDAAGNAVSATNGALEAAETANTAAIAANDVARTVLTTVTGKNILFPPTRITEGKYLNPSTGNYGNNDGFMVVEDYYPVSPSTSYVGAVYDRTGHTFGGAWAGHVCFYDAAKHFLSGVTVPTATGVFVTPENCAFIRISNETHVYNQYVWQIEKGDSVSGATYEAYWSKTVINPARVPYVTVDAAGFGDYRSINDAVQAAADGATVYIMPGTYVEQVKAWGKTVHLIGVSKENCVLKDTGGNYSAPPLEISSGSVENLTIVEDCPDLSAITDTMGANAIHIDNNDSSDKRLCIRNCIIKSNASSAVGIGLRKGFDLVFEQCLIVCGGAFNSTGAGPVHFHDADQPSYYGVSNVTIRNCVLKNTSSDLFSMLTINSIHAENTTYMNFNHNIFTREAADPSHKFNTWNTDGGSYDGFNGLRNMYLTAECFGNNVPELNISV